MNEFMIAIDNGKPFKIQGKDALDAMICHGYIIETRVTSGKHYVGKLTDGRRYRVCYQYHHLKSRFGKPLEVNLKTGEQ